MQISSPYVHELMQTTPLMTLPVMMTTTVVICFGVGTMIYCKPPTVEPSRSISVLVGIDAMVAGVGIVQPPLPHLMQQRSSTQFFFLTGATGASSGASPSCWSILDAAVEYHRCLKGVVAAVMFLHCPYGGGCSNIVVAACEVDGIVAMAGA